MHRILVDNITHTRHCVCFKTKRSRPKLWDTQEVWHLLYVLKNRTHCLVKHMILSAGMRMRMCLEIILGLFLWCMNFNVIACGMYVSGSAHGWFNLTSKCHHAPVSHVRTQLLKHMSMRLQKHAIDRYTNSIKYNMVIRVALDTHATKSRICQAAHTHNRGASVDLKSSDLWWFASCSDGHQNSIHSGMEWTDWKVQLITYTVDGIN